MGPYHGRRVNRYRLLLLSSGGSIDLSLKDDWGCGNSRTQGERRASEEERRFRGKRLEAKVYEVSFLQTRP